MQDTKSLKKLIKFLRSQGITEYSEGGIHLKLGPEPIKSAKRSAKAKQDVTEQVNVDPSIPSREELLFWSADPALNTQNEDDNGV